MKDIKINNQEVLDILNDYKDWLIPKHHNGDIDRDLKLNCKDDIRDDFISDDYLQSVIAKGKGHDGYPESMRSYAGTMPDTGIEIREESIPYRDKGVEMNTKLLQHLSARKNSLVSLYPPGGWISWHNNANSAGYNILFSWSETGDGWFDYWDLEKKERVHMPDVKGWQCKMGYFGSYDEPERLCYHAASTECLRISVAYVFAAPFQVSGEGIWQDVIDDIEENW